MPSQRSHKLSALFVLFFLLFNQPLLGLLERDHTIGNMPLMYRGIFALWLLFIVLLFVLMEHRRGQQTPPRS
ncbi:MAG: hypothetical protein OHK0039_28760 [Bacteroidia bacterium]